MLWLAIKRRCGQSSGCDVKAQAPTPLSSAGCTTNPVCRLQAHTVHHIAPIRPVGCIHSRPHSPGRQPPPSCTVTSTFSVGPKVPASCTGD
ncbi:hypothetical protein GQ53DRAFT_741648 [Thozetella sp. PMI_491]|nr:hypothetical protein GQ53DRAFT_741648 [Thozetella sp. PMI_491]